MSTVMRRPAQPMTSAEAGKARSLAPHEHGAYGQLLVPLAGALALSRPTVASASLAAASVVVFFAHEPLLLLLGQRGQRALREDGERARQRLAVLGALAIGLGGLGMALASLEAQVALVAPVILGCAVAGAVVRKVERTTPGEILASTALASVSFPVAIAQGVTASTAALAWGIWSVSFAVATVAVRSVIAKAKKAEVHPLVRAAPVHAVVATGALAALGHHGLVPMSAALALLPVAVLAGALGVWPVHPRHLRRVGWALVAASFATLAVMVVALR